MNEEERLRACEEIAVRMYVAGLGWNYDAIVKLTAPELPTMKAIRELQRMTHPTPHERGVLNRYQDRRRR